MSEWIAYHQIEPIGEQRADLRAGIIASTIANANRSKRSKSFRASDFMMFIDKPKPSASMLMQMFRASIAGVK